MDEQQHRQWIQSITRAANAVEAKADHETEVGIRIRNAAVAYASEMQTQYSVELPTPQVYRTSHFLARRVGCSDLEKCVTLNEHLQAIQQLRVAQKRQRESRLLVIALGVVLAFVAFLAGRLMPS